MKFFIHFEFNKLSVHGYWKIVFNFLQFLDFFLGKDNLVLLEAEKNWAGICVSSLNVGFWVDFAEVFSMKFWFWNGIRHFFECRTDPKVLKLH